VTSLAANQARAVLWAQWRSYRNYGGGRWVWLSYVLGAVWYGAWLAAGLATGVLMSRAEAVDLTVQIAAVLLLMSLYWQFIPMMMAASGLSLELQKLKIYPIPVSQLFTIEVLLRVTAALEMLLILSGAALGLLFNPALSGFRALGVLPFAAFHMLLALGLRDAVVRLLGRRKIREIAALFFVALFTVPRFLLGRTGINRWLAAQFNESEPGSGIPWLPWVATAHLFTGNDPWTSAAVMVAWCGLAGVFALWQFQRTLRFDPEAAQSAGSGEAKDSRPGFVERFYRFPSTLLRDPLGALLEKEMRYLLRAARFRMLFLMSCAIGLVMARAFSRGPATAGFTWGPSFLTPASAYTLLMLGEVCIWNVFGFDRSAAQMYFVAPVPFARVLLAKNLAAVACIALAQLTTILLCTAFGFPVTASIILDTAAVIAVVTLYLLSAGNYMSISNARPTDPDSSMRSRSAGGAQALLLFLYPVVFLPAALAYFARWAFDSQLAFFGVLAVMGAIGAVAYYVALESTVEFAERKKESMVAALSANQGPIWFACPLPYGRGSVLRGAECQH
jgi:ABC-2 type transport system permease protein